MMGMTETKHLGEESGRELRTGFVLMYKGITERRRKSSWTSPIIIHRRGKINKVEK